MNNRKEPRLLVHTRVRLNSFDSVHRCTPLYRDPFMGCVGTITKRLGNDCGFYSYQIHWDGDKNVSGVTMFADELMPVTEPRYGLYECVYVYMDGEYRYSGRVIGFEYEKTKMQCRYTVEDASGNQRQEWEQCLRSPPVGTPVPPVPEPTTTPVTDELLFINKKSGVNCYGAILYTTEKSILVRQSTCGQEEILLSKDEYSVFQVVKL